MEEVNFTLKRVKTVLTFTGHIKRWESILWAGIEDIVDPTGRRMDTVLIYKKDYLSLSLTLTHTHTYIHSLTHSHTHIHTHKHTHTFSFSLSDTRTHLWWWVSTCVGLPGLLEVTIIERVVYFGDTNFAQVQYQWLLKDLSPWEPRNEKDRAPIQHTHTHTHTNTHTHTRTKVEMQLTWKKLSVYLRSRFFFRS